MHIASIGILSAKGICRQLSDLHGQRTKDGDTGELPL